MTDIDNLLKIVLEHPDNKLTSSSKDILETIINHFKDIKNILSPEKASQEEKDEIIGHLNRCYGFNGYKKCEIGTDVYKTPTGYYFFAERLSDGSTQKMIYSNSLKEHIDFL